MPKRKFPVEDDLLDTEEDLINQRPETKRPEPTPMLEVSPSVVGDLIMTWDFFRLYHKILPVGPTQASLQFTLEDLQTALLDDQRATAPGGPSARLLRSMCMSLLRMLCCRSENGGKAQVLTQSSEGERVYIEMVSHLIQGGLESQWQRHAAPSASGSPTDPATY